MGRTVRNYLEDTLFSIGFRTGEYERATNFIIQEMNKRSISTRRTLKRKDGNEVLLRDCWNTEANDYLQQDLEWLFDMSVLYVLQWCLNVIHSQK